MPWPVHPTGFFGARGDQDTYRIERSLRFNSDDSAYLNRTQATPTSSGTFTFSCWLKRARTNAGEVIFYGGNSRGVGQPGSDFGITSTGQLYIDNSVGSGNYVLWSSSGLLRDTSAWYHIAFNQTGSTVNVYVNGTLFWNTTTTASNYFNGGSIHLIGGGGIDSSITGFLGGYLTEIHFIDGQALTPSSFGETDAITGRWKAKAYSGTYGTNGFYLKFADNSGTTATTLGKDSSPNGNNWTPNNFSVTAGSGNDSLVDSPTNYGTDSGVGGEVRGNYSTLNSLWNYSSTLSNGNLDWSTSTLYGQSCSSIAVSSGKWYWETNVTSVGMVIGIISTGINPSSSLTGSRTYYSGNGNKYTDATPSSYGASYTNGDVIGCALDLDNGNLVFYKNNVSQGTAFTGLSGSYHIGFIAADNSFSRSASINFGQRPFAYTAPSGFKALCTTNLPTPAIQKPSKYMDVVTYTGNNSARSITGLNFSPDLVWIKSRSAATWNFLFDAVRGATKWLASNQTGAEATNTTSLTSFDSGGFSLSTDPAPDTSTGWNANSATYVAWAWDEAPIAGMDIVAFTAPASGNTTVSHSLGVTPRMIIAKSRNSSTSWTVYHASATTKDQYLFLNTTNAVQTLTDVWGSAAPTSSVFGFNSNNQGASASVIAYLFAEVEGFSRFGSYTGNGSADGPFVWCGFRPRFLLVKQSSGGTESWRIIDSQRDLINDGALDELYPNLSNAEGASSAGVDILSSGFKVRQSGSGWNLSGGTYIFAAFAESPFKYSRAR